MWVGYFNVENFEMKYGNIYLCMLYNVLVMFVFMG